MAIPTRGPIAPDAPLSSARISLTLAIPWSPVESPDHICAIIAGLFIWANACPTAAFAGVRPSMLSRFISE